MHKFADLTAHARQLKRNVLSAFGVHVEAVEVPDLRRVEVASREDARHVRVRVRYFVFVRRKLFKFHFVLYFYFIK